MKIENHIADFVQNIADCEWSAKNEYLQFIYAENVDTDALISSLNTARLIHKLYILSKETIEKDGIKPNSSKYQPFTKDSLLTRIRDMQADIDKMLEKLKNIYDESFDIDDEEEYLKVQKEVREKRKKIRELKKLCDLYREVVENYLPIVFTQLISSEYEENISVSNIPETDNPKSFVVKDITDNKEKISTTKSPSQVESNTDDFNLKEAMIDIFLSEDEKIAKNKGKRGELTSYILHKLIRQIYGKAVHFLEISEILKQDSSFVCIDPESYILNKKIISNSVAQPPLSKIAGISSILKKVDFNHPQNYKYCKPISFKFDGSTYTVDSWKKLYELFLKCICYDDRYANLMKNQIGKSLYGKSIDFADDKFFVRLRTPINISSNFYAEGNLSTIQIIKYIKKLMELCSIDSSRMIIEYDDTIKAPQNETDGETESLDLQENETNIDSSLLHEKDGKVEKITLELNGNTVDVYDCNDAWQKICEFAIRRKPFTMAYVFKSEINLNEKKLFYRQPASIDGYIRLSNNLQVLKVENYSDLSITVEKLKKYCDLDDSMITIKEI